MPMVDTSRESFEKIKASLQTFKRDIYGFSLKINSMSENIVGDCRADLDKQSQNVEKIEKDFENVKNKLDEKKEEEKAEKENIEKAKARKKELESEKKSIEMRINSLKAQKSSLDNRSSNKDDEDAIEKATEIQDEISDLESEKNDLENSISEQEEKENEAQNKLDEIQNDIDELTEEFEKLKKELENNKIKFEKMKDDYKKIEDSYNQLKSKTRYLESDSSNAASHSLSCVDQCLQYIDEYENISFCSGMRPEHTETHDRYISDTSSSGVLDLNACDIALEGIRNGNMRMVDISSIDVRGSDEEHFWEHHGRSEQEWRSGMSDYVSMMNDIANGTNVNECQTRHEHAWNMMFGVQPIELSQGDGDLVVTNGRHRIAMAQSLGITHLPAILY